MDKTASIELRLCGSFDPPLLAALQEACFPDDPWNSAAITALLALPNSWGLLASQGDLPLGYVLLRQAADELEILTLGVLPDSRQSGIGQKLLKDVIIRAWQQEVTEIFLEVAEDNRAAFALYHQQSFVQVGRRRSYYQRRGEVACDALILRLARSPEVDESNARSNRAAR